MARASGREIEREARRRSGLLWYAELAVRLAQMQFWIGVVLVWFPLLWLRERNRAAALGVAVSFLFRRLGATFIKVGQIISTRPDAFPPEFIAPLTSLQDRVPPFPFAAARKTIAEDFGRPLEEIFTAFSEQPVASASIAQVHRAVVGERTVAVKVRRPGIVRRAYLDEAILHLGARLLSWLPTAWLLSPVEGVAQFCDAVNLQLDFEIEAANNRRFRELFANDPQVVFPELVEELCTDRVLTMEFIDGVKVDEIRAVRADPVFCARKGVELACRMIHQHGFVHADVHPGNLLYMTGNRVALLDVGLVAEMDDDKRRKFALFNFFMATGMGREAAKVLYDIAPWKRVASYEAYERDVMELATRIANRPLEELQLTVIMAMTFAIIRRHRLQMDPSYTMVQVALMVVEGLGHKLDPTLNLSWEARPLLEMALGLRGPVPPLVPDAEPADEALPASVGGGRYQIVGVLGEGARKRVYRARDGRLDREVAIAFLKVEAVGETDLASILREAQAMAKLGDHRGIVAVHDVGEEDGRPYIVSQCMSGGTLEELLNRSPERRLAIEHALAIAGQICDALAYAHAHGIVHRDLKPANVWLTQGGEAKLGDFGLVASLDESSSSSPRAIVGTATYLSPEQALGRRPDPRSDLYSLGAVAYEMVTGRPPFVGDSAAAVIAKHIGEEPPAPSSLLPTLPRGVERWILGLLAKSAEERPQTAAIVRDAIRELERSPGDASPSASAPRPETPDQSLFVGRADEMKTLLGAVDAAAAGHGRLLLVAGEPGIGKTRTAEQVANVARARGFRVLVGRSYEGEGAPAYWPWVQVVRAYLDGAEPERANMVLGPSAAELAQIVPELREVFPGLAEPPPLEAEQARFRLFDSAAKFVKAASRSEPLYIFLDDLHWADKATLLLLVFLAREMADARLLVVGTYRDIEVRLGHPLSDVLPSLRRERVFQRVLLRGLREDEVSDLLGTLAGRQVARTFVEAISRETEGNPLFIGEILRHLIEEGILHRQDERWTSRAVLDEIGLPESVREVIGRRLARLSARCTSILTIAAVVGRAFDAAVLEAVSGASPETVGESLEEARAARIVEEDRGVPGRYRFCHVLIRDTLYEAVRRGERVRLHREIAEAIETRHRRALEPHLAELAYHFGEAAKSTGDPRRAIEFAIRAGDDALRRVAHEEAAVHYERALDVVDLAGQPDPLQRCELLLKLGEAQAHSRNAEASRDTFRKAAALAEKIGAAELFARAALGHGGPLAQFRLFRIDERLIGLLERALELLPQADSVLRAKVLARLAEELGFLPQEERRRALAREAIEMTRRVGDAAALAGVLVRCRFATWGPDDHEERLATIYEIIRLSADAGNLFLEQQARSWAFGDRLEMADITSAKRELEQVIRATERLPTHFSRAVTTSLRSMDAQLEGRAAEALQLAEEATQIAAQEQSWQEASIALTLERVVVRAFNGWLSASELESLRNLLDHSPPLRDARAGVAMIHSLVGDVEATRAELERVWPKSLAAIRRDALWLVTVVTLAEAVTLVRDADRAAELYDLMLPFADRCAIITTVIWMGSVSRSLGGLAAVLGRYDDAVAHFEDAIETHERVGAKGWLAVTHRDYGRMLLARDLPGDRAEALRHLSDAVEIATGAGMAGPVLGYMLALKLAAQGAEASLESAGSIHAVVASVGAKRPDLTLDATDGTVTLLFSDMEGFTETTERLGDREAHRLMQIHNAIIRDELRGRGGREIEAQGDGFFLVFPTARAALGFAVAVQKAMARWSVQNPDKPLRVRMGIHTGEPIKEGDTFFGLTVILAARIAAQAAGGQILVSQIVKELVEGVDEFAFDEGEDLSLKGLAGTHRAFPVAWGPEATPRRRQHAAVVAAEPSPAPPIVRREAGANVFRKEGDFWLIAYERQSLRMKHAKGLEYIGRLLRHVGEELHVADLLNGGGEAPAPLGDAGAALDPQARAEYKERLADLEAELEEAESFNDAGRRARIREEIDFLTRELSAAYGLGGRARKGADANERARKAVSGRVKDSLARIKKQHPLLGLHLTNSLRLGTFCSYQPAERIPWDLDSGS